MHTEGARDRLHTNSKTKTNNTHLYHTLKKNKKHDASDTRVAPLSQRKMLLRHQIYTEIRHKNLSIASEHR